VARGKGASQARGAPITARPVTSMRPEATVPTTIPSSTGETTLAMENGSP
jgi:hypothetical protein